MASATEFQGTVSAVQSDLDTLVGFTATIDTTLTAADTVLGLPSQIETELRNSAAKIDLPNPIVTVLSALPFGIGTAIKQLDNIANSVSGTVDKQADVMLALDLAWQPAKTFVDTSQIINSSLNATFGAFKNINQGRVNEADLLVTSLGDQYIWDGSQLATRMADYTAIAETWFTTRDNLLAPLQSSIASVNAVIDAIDNAVPDVSQITSALNSALAVFNSAADIARDIEDALDVTINLPWPIPDANVLDILADIASWAQVVVDLVEDFVIDALALIGIDINKVFDAVANEMLGFLNPIFGILDALQSTVAPLLNDLNSAINGMFGDVNALVREVQKAVDAVTVFDNVIVGDTGGPTVIDDDIVGGNMEDAIFGLTGNDTINGGGNSDFLFGGADDDMMLGGAGNDEMFGGTGADKLVGVAGNNLLDGGDDDDILLAQSGNDVLLGGSGLDIMITGGGADTIVFREGNEVDVAVDFRDNVDTIAIDSALKGGAFTAQQFINQNAISFGGNTLINTGSDKLLVLGVSANDLVDDIQFI